MDYSDEDFGNDEVDDDLDYDEDEELLAEDGGDWDSRPEKHYTILKEERIKQLQNNDISEVSNVLSVTRGLACTLLLQNNWSQSSVFEEWFANEERARESIGILAKQESPKLDNNSCNICFETIEIENMLSCLCGHPFCLDCLKMYISVSINDGPGCLTFRCPEPKCRANVGPDMVDSLASDEDKDKYYWYLLRSYVEGNRELKWCPGPGCVLAVHLDVCGRENYDVTCDCSCRFCWNCTEESHRPVDCETVSKWIKMNTSEEENNKWITAYTKPCPKCHKKIEKNQGCNHMTCLCGSHFCWLCLKPWSIPHSCNKYADEEVNESLQTTRKNLYRYAHYYERWASNHKSRDIALADLKRMKNEHVEMLSQVQEEYSRAQLKFAVEAWEQIIECRLVLKWTYAYGFYLTGKRKFFECLQGDAEAALERLHHCAENEMEKYVKADCPSGDFRDFREKLCNLTGVTRKYFENLVRALENDLCEVKVTETSKTMRTESSTSTVEIEKRKISKVVRQPQAQRIR